MRKKIWEQAGRPTKCIENVLRPTKKRLKMIIDAIWHRYGNQVPRATKVCEAVQCVRLNDPCIQLRPLTQKSKLPHASQAKIILMRAVLVRNMTYFGLYDDILLRHCVSLRAFFVPVSGACAFPCVFRIIMCSRSMYNWYRDTIAWESRLARFHLPFRIRTSSWSEGLSVGFVSCRSANLIALLYTALLSFWSYSFPFFLKAFCARR